MSFSFKLSLIFVLKTSGIDASETKTHIISAQDETCSMELYTISFSNKSFFIESTLRTPTFIDKPESLRFNA